MKTYLLAPLGLLVMASMHCSSQPAPSAESSADQTEKVRMPARDWSRHPAIVETDSADEIFALSDPHGGYEPLVRLLAANKLVDGMSADPTKVRWTGGSSLLVIAGDLIDKGPQSLEVIDLIRSLEKQSGGKVIATMGNHEAEFFVDYKNDKATSTGKDQVGVDGELKTSGVDPAVVVAGRDAKGRGAWLSSLPLGVRVKKWFFSHSGNTNGLSIKDLEKKLEHAIDSNGYGDKEITGNDSILEAQNWYGNPDKDKTAQKNADALGVNHIVFGHDPGALGAEGHLKASKDGVLFKIDCAMGLQVNGGTSKGFILHIKTAGKDSAESLDETGAAKNML